MHAGQHAVWSVATERWMIFPIVALAGCAIAWLTARMPEQSIDELIADTAHATPGNNPAVRAHYRRRGLLIAASAFIAVAAGGAIGPEAGIIALTGELSALVTWKMRNAAARRRLQEIAVSSSLGALYGSPPAGVAYERDQVAPHRLVDILADTAGLGAFLTVVKISNAPSARIAVEDITSFTPHMVLAMITAAIVGTLVACGYCWIDHAAHHFAQQATQRIGRARFIIAASVILALMLTVFPHARFAGEHELHELTAHALDQDGAAAWCSPCCWSEPPAELDAHYCSPQSPARASPWPRWLGAVPCSQLSPGNPSWCFLLLLLVPGIAWVPMLIGIAVGSMARYVTPEPVAH